jgi:hypothetical protein
MKELDMSNKKKTVEQIVKLNIKQWRSWFNNSNSSRPVKLWLDEYLNQLTKAELYSLISELCDKIHELDEGE